MTGHSDSDRAGREPLTAQDLLVATLVGRYVERRERGDAPCAHDLLAAAAELGDKAVDELRAVVTFYEAMRADEGIALTGRPATRWWHALAGVRVAGDRPASGASHQVQEDHVSKTIQPAGRQVALEHIHVPDNVRALDDAHVKALAGSIKLQGVLVPVVVRDNGTGGYELVAGFHRIAAARELGLSEVPVVVRDADSEDADRAVENATSCRRRHEVIYADRVVMPTSR